jgi:DNA-binding CsgD family transcriptional regulator
MGYNKIIWLKGKNVMLAVAIQEKHIQIMQEEREAKINLIEKMIARGEFYLELLGGGNSVASLAKELGVSRATIRNYRDIAQNKDKLLGADVQSLRGAMRLITEPKKRTAYDEWCSLDGEVSLSICLALAEPFYNKVYPERYKDFNTPDEFYFGFDKLQRMQSLYGNSIMLQKWKDKKKQAKFTAKLISKWQDIYQDDYDELFDEVYSTEVEYAKEWLSEYDDLDTAFIDSFHIKLGGLSELSVAD